MKLLIRQKSRCGFLVGIVLCAVVLSGYAELIVNYDGGGFAASASHADISVSGVGITGDWARSSASGNFYISGAANVPTGAIDSSEYVKFAVNPLAETISYSTVYIDFGGDNNASATPYTITVELRSSVDSYASVLGTDVYTIPVKSKLFKSASFDLSGTTALQGLTTTTEFRFYVYDDSDNTGVSTFIARVDNFGATGSVVPEPATVGMLGVGALVTLMARRRMHC